MTGGKPWMLIVVNPVSGGKSKRRFIFMSRKYFRKYYNVRWLFWKKPDQDITADIRKELLIHKYHCIVAAGGDGTVNQTARAVTGTGIPVGIIPLGSGNGLARHLGYRIRIKEAMEIIHQCRTMRMDAACINGEKFFCSSGTGFDAHIGRIFAGLSKRGPASYVKCVIRELRKYKSLEYKITIDGIENIRTAFLVTVANAGQYGNNAWIAPKASLQDGLLDVTVLHPFSIAHAPDLAMKLFRKRFDKNHKVETFRGKNIVVEEIQREIPITVHYDGEPAVMNGPLNFSIDAMALMVIVP